MYELSEEETPIVTEIFSRSRLASAIPDDALCYNSDRTCKEDFREYFFNSVKHAADRYRQSIPWERELTTPSVQKATFERIAKLADSLNKNRAEVLELLSSLDERTRASLEALDPEFQVKRAKRHGAEEVNDELSAALALIPRRITHAAIEWLAQPHMAELAELARHAHGRYLPRRGLIAHEQPRRAGLFVMALFQTFSIPYTATSQSGTARDSDAVGMFHLVTGIAGRVEHYLP